MSIPRYFLFLCGQIGIMSLSRFLYQWIITYGALDDSETKLFPAITLGIVFFSFRVFDGITDPVAGKLTDSWARKGFQRRTLLWVSFSLAPIGLTLTFLANHSHSKPFAWALLTLGLLIFFIGYTFYAIPYWSLIDDYAQGDMKVRAKLSNLLGLGIVLASGIGFVASGALIEKLSGLPEPELIWEGGEFTEGPAVGPDGSVLFSDVGADSIYKFSPANKKVTTFRERSGRANGLIFDPEGNLIACEGANTGGGRRISVTSKNGKVRTLTKEWQGNRFNSPNDLAIDSAGKNIYFTDPRYVGEEKRELEFEGIFMVRPDGSTELATKEVKKPNGIIFSKDGKKVFVADHEATNDGTRQLLSFSVTAEGKLENKQILHDFGSSRGIDGMALGPRGNIFATAGSGKEAGIYVFDPSGNLLQVINLPGDPTNCTFGYGKNSLTLYVTAQSPKGQKKQSYALYRLRLDEPDPLGYSMAALSFGGISVFLMVLPFFASPKKTNRIIKKDKPTEIQTESSSLWSGIIQALRHRRFLALIALFGGSQMSFTVMTAAAPFIATELLGGSVGDVAQLLGPLLGIAVICFLFVPKIQQRFGWLRSMLYASIALSIVYACCGLLGKSLIISPLMTASVVFGLGGPMIAVLLGVEAEGVVDCAKERGGESLVGIYWGAFNFVVKILNGIAILLASILIQLHQSQESWETLAIRSMGFLAGGCLLAGVGFYYIISPNKKHKASAL